MLSASNTLVESMIHINVGEMFFIPMHVHNELFNGVRQVRWQHLSHVHVVSIFSKSIWYPPFSFKALRPPSFVLSVSFCGTLSRFHNKWSFPAVWRC